MRAYTLIISALLPFASARWIQVADETFECTFKGGVDRGNNAHRKQAAEWFGGNSVGDKAYRLDQCFKNSAPGAQDSYEVWRLGQTTVNRYQCKDSACRDCNSIASSPYPPQPQDPCNQSTFNYVMAGSANEIVPLKYSAKDGEPAATTAEWDRSLEQWLRLDRYADSDAECKQDPVAVRVQRYQFFCEPVATGVWVQHTPRLPNKSGTLTPQVCFERSCLDCYPAENNTKLYTGGCRPQNEPGTNVREVVYGFRVVERSSAYSAGWVVKVDGWTVVAVAAVVATLSAL
ncbi:hypothetical protein HK097_002175 [Rhizophlyctis rosea]|uniref:Secreted protein n=1 Tax=Rhizophlyctis rosea TaxID=64517 RepID=A0AAD5SH81_9FUNG|nr:hypothetical protein HK097_002175 [Rhizophlyctis rosea]